MHCNLASQIINIKHLVVWWIQTTKKMTGVFCCDFLCHVKITWIVVVFHQFFFQITVFLKDMFPPNYILYTEHHASGGYFECIISCHFSISQFAASPKHEKKDFHQKTPRCLNVNLAHQHSWCQSQYTYLSSKPKLAEYATSMVR